MVREKTVFTRNELSHVYARQSQAFGKEPGGRMYFEGATIYSYGRHFAIARVIRCESGFIGARNICLFTSRDYSNTTSAHKSAVRYAMSHYEKIFVPYPEDTDPNYQNARLMIREAESIYEKVIRGRDRVPDYISEIRNLFKNLRAYSKEVKKPLNREYRRRMLKIEKKIAADFPPEKIEMIRAAAEERRSKLRAGAEERRRIKWYQWDERQKAAAEERRKKEEERRAKFLELTGDNFAKWRAGEVDWSEMFDDAEGNTILRIKNGQIESSKSMSCSFDEGRALFILWKHGKAFGAELAGFKVHESTAAGIKIGCHTITAAEIEKIAAQLNW